MSKKTSIWVGEPLARLSVSLKPSNSFSGAVNRVADRYQHICRADVPNLTTEELQVVANCLSGTFIDPVTVEYLWQEIEDFDDIKQQPIEYPELVEKIKRMTIGERYALLEKLGF